MSARAAGTQPPVASLGLLKSRQNPSVQALFGEICQKTETKLQKFFKCYLLVTDMSNIYYRLGPNIRLSTEGGPRVFVFVR